MGAVYLAEKLGTQERVAVKVLHPDRQQKETLAKRFMREAQISALLNHPNTISVYDYGQDPDSGALWLAMEFLDGKTLYRFVRERKHLDLQTASSITFQILSSLGNAHENGIIHRDLKPGNVMIMERPGQPLLVKVLDFGIAKVHDPGAFGGDINKRMTALTQFGEMLGTPHYMPPEQIRGQELSASADLYALGVILFFMLTGRRPFEDKEGIHVTIAQLTTPFPRLSSISTSARLPASVQELLDKSSMKEPKERFQTAADFGQALMRVVQHLAPPPAPSSGVSRVAAARPTAPASPPRVVLPSSQGGGSPSGAPVPRYLVQAPPQPVSPPDPDFDLLDNEQATRADPNFLQLDHVDSELGGGSGTVPALQPPLALIDEVPVRGTLDATIPAESRPRYGVLEGTSTLQESSFPPSSSAPASSSGSAPEDAFMRTVPDLSNSIGAIPRPRPPAPPPPVPTSRVAEANPPQPSLKNPVVRPSASSGPAASSAPPPPALAAPAPPKKEENKPPAPVLPPPAPQSPDPFSPLAPISSLTQPSSLKRWALLMLFFLALAASGAVGTYLIIQLIHKG